MSRQTTSASAAPDQAVSTMARSSRRFGAKMPGVSTKTTCDEPCMAMPRMIAPRRLYLVADYRHLGADQAVEKRRLAGVGSTDQRHEAGASWGVDGRGGIIGHRVSLSGGGRVAKIMSFLFN